MSALENPIFVAATETGHLFIFPSNSLKKQKSLLLMAILEKLLEQFILKQKKIRFFFFWIQ